MAKKMTPPKKQDARYDREVGPKVPRNVRLRPLAIPRMRSIKRP
jgi:hypothetical protein